jgi:hypothetical protein
MMMYKSRINELAKVGHHALVSKEKKILWRYDTDDRINGIHVLSIGVSPKEEQNI